MQNKFVGETASHLTQQPALADGQPRFGLPTDGLRKAAIAVAMACSLSACQLDINAPQTATISQITPAQLSAMANQLEVEYRLIDNDPLNCPTTQYGNECYTATLDITSPQLSLGTGWNIYFSLVAPLASVDSDEFTITHINGDLHRIAPGPEYRGIAAGETRTLHFKVQNGQNTKSEAMPNYYLTMDHRHPAQQTAVVIESTRTALDADTGLESQPYVKGYDQPQLFKRRVEDNSRLATAAVLYDNNHLPEVADSVIPIIVPTPSTIKLASTNSQLDLASGLNVSLQGLEHQHVAVALNRLASFGIKEHTGGVNLSIAIDANAVANGAKIQQGSYQLKISNSGISIIAEDNEGAANALNSLASLITLGNTNVPLVTIDDSPRFAFRGMHIDVARNFHSKEFILDMLDQMAAFKLNKLHLHLADDEGWRLEIKDLPELTDVGSKRCHDLKEDRCLLPQLGSGPTGKTAVDGYYSIADYQEILRAATARHIQVIPSLDMPGHARAAIKSMEARYRRLMAQGQADAAKQYLLSDLDDTTQYSSIQFYTDNTLNVCQDSTYAFIEKVIDEMSAMHNEAEHPMTRYHIGADETAGAWVESPVCKDYIANNPELDNVKQLGPYFIQRVAGLLDKRQIETAGWGDGLSHTDPAKMPAFVHANAWGTLSQHGIGETNTLANNGWDMVMSTPEATYFDMPYEADHNERGYAWATRYTNTRKAFNFMPENLPAHAELWTDKWGNPVVLDDRPQQGEAGHKGHQPINSSARITGLQGQLWSETVRSTAIAEHMIFPRFFALAERAWNQGEWELDYNHQGQRYTADTRHFDQQRLLQRDQQWARFASHLASKELPKLDQAGIQYRLPTAGAKILNGQLHANAILPGLAIEYRQGTGAWMRWDMPVAVSGKVEVRTVAPNGQRRGRILKVN